MSLKNVFISFPRLETDRFVLRQMLASDANSLFKLYSDPEVARYLDWSGIEDLDIAGMILEHWQKQYQRGENIRWAICPKAGGELIGTVVLSNFRHKAIADLGYDLGKDHWGKGIMMEVLNRVIRFAFDDLGLIRIQAYVRPQNIASAMLLQKLDFKLEGILQRAGFHEHKREFFDLQLFAMINPQAQ